MVELASGFCYTGTWAGEKRLEARGRRLEGLVDTRRPQRALPELVLLVPAYDLPMVTAHQLGDEVR